MTAMARRKRSTHPVFYFNFRSPYSWLAYHDLMERYPDVARVLEWRPWWEPDAANERRLNEAGGTFSYVAMSKEKHLYILQDVRRLTRDRGLSVTWPVDRDPVWEVPHLPYFVARELGRAPEYVSAVYEARWHRGMDICDPATIAVLAAELGLPVDRMTGAATDPGLREKEAHQALLALSDAGAFGPPFFTHGFDKFWGVDRLPAFVESVRASLDGAPAEALPEADFTAALAGDQGHPGGCG
ncbi:isomerase [Streptomyces sp. SAJ15]|nr:isomerase [Streptomyces sp. SAJ15]